MFTSCKYKYYCGHLKLDFFKHWTTNNYVTEMFIFEIINFNTYFAFNFNRLVFYFIKVDPACCDRSLANKFLLVFNSFTDFCLDFHNKCKLLHSYRFRYTVFNKLKQIANIMDVTLKTNMESTQDIGSTRANSFQGKLTS